MRLVHVSGIRSSTVPVWGTDFLYSTEKEDSLGLWEDSQAAFLGNGSLLISGSDEVYRFDSSGELRGRLGRIGDGPGEYRNPWQLLVAPDGGVLVADRTGRITQFRDDGEFARVIARLKPPSELELDPIGTMADGRILATYWQQRPNRAGHPGIAAGSVERDSAPLMIYDSTGTVTGRVGLWKGLERVQLTLGGELSLVPPPFARSAIYDGRGAATVFGTSDSLDLSVFSGSRLVLRLIASTASTAPSADMLTAWDRAMREAHPDIPERYAQAIRSAAPASSLPAAAGVVIDDRSNIWVADFAPPFRTSRRWWIFSDQGAPLGRIDLPPFADPLVPGRLELLDVAGDRLALLRRGTNGEAIVEVRAIRRPPRL